MPNKLSKDKVRISYAEDAEVRYALEKLAKKRGATLSELVKEATGEYLARRSGKPAGRGSKPAK